MSTFLDILYPTSLTYLLESQAANQYNTSVISNGGDVGETRNARWGTFPRRRFMPQVATMERTQVEQIRDFHDAVLGKTYSFALEWPTDLTALDSLIENLAGGTAFQLRKEITIPYYRWDETTEQTFLLRYKPIRLCVPTSVFLSLNGESLPVSQNPDFNDLFNGPDFNPDAQITASVTRGGALTLSQSIASSDILRATFNYHFQVRFEDDSFLESYKSLEAWSAGLSMIETNDPTS